MNAWKPQVFCDGSRQSGLSRLHACLRTQVNTRPDWTAMRLLPVVVVVGVTLSLYGFGNAAYSQSVAGSVQFEREIDNLNVHVGFSARKHADGYVRGQAQMWTQFDNHLDFGSHFSIEALEFVDENTAILSGFVTHDTSPDFVGSTFAWVVRDNGERAIDPPDQSTGILYSLDFGGKDFLGIDAVELEEFFNEIGVPPLDVILEAQPSQGNIQVWPQGPPSLAAQSIPEPSSVLVGIMAVVGLMMLRRNRLLGNPCAS